METEEEPEVQISDQDINPIVLDASVSDPQQGLRPPGDFLVPLDPEECSGENLSPRLWSASRLVWQIACSGELGRNLNAQV